LNQYGKVFSWFPKFAFQIQLVYRYTEDEFGEFLSASEQLLLLERRNTILRYLDHLVDTQGYDKTVIH
jgi:hypothetical protein